MCKIYKFYILHAVSCCYSKTYYYQIWGMVGGAKRALQHLSNHSVWTITNLTLKCPTSTHIPLLWKGCLTNRYNRHLSNIVFKFRKFFKTWKTHELSRRFIQKKARLKFRNMGQKLKRISKFVLHNYYGTL